MPCLHYRRVLLWVMYRLVQAHPSLRPSGFPAVAAYFECDRILEICPLCPSGCCHRILIIRWQRRSRCQLWICRKIYNRCQQILAYIRTRRYIRIVFVHGVVVHSLLESKGRRDGHPSVQTQVCTEGWQQDGQATSWHSMWASFSAWRSSLSGQTSDRKYANEGRTQEVDVKHFAEKKTTFA